jgi:hypothetical protein
MRDGPRSTEALQLSAPRAILPAHMIANRSTRFFAFTGKRAELPIV